MARMKKCDGENGAEVSIAPSNAVNRYDGILILILLIVILSGFMWVVVFSTDSSKVKALAAAKRSKTAANKAELLRKDNEEPRFVSGIVSSVKAIPLLSNALTIEFNTSKPALCSIAVGYNSLRPKYRKVDGFEYSTKHVLTARDLLSGQVFYLISGKLKDGTRFVEPIRISRITLPQKLAKKTDETGGKQVLLSNISDLLGEGKSNDGVITHIDDSASDENVNDTGYDDSGNLVPQNLVTYSRPLPNASSDTPLGKRALSASTIDRKFGPDSLSEMSREKQEKHIKWLHGEFKKYEDARGASELADAYFEYKDYRKALRYASQGVKIDSNHISSHKVRLKVYTKFAMGWKVKETQKKINKLLSPAERKLEQAKFAENERIYGNYRTRGTPQVVSIK